MKSCIHVELFDSEGNQMFNLYRKVFYDGGCGDYWDEMMGKSIGAKSWVAHIVGPDHYGGYVRHFLHGKRDYAGANSKGTRGIMLEFILDSGKIYEVNSQVSWRRFDRYFCTVDCNGNILKLDEGEVKLCLNIT